jgi:subtilisin family serine protease
MDDQGHGTHVAGTIGAVGNNGLGVAGINWNVKIMALKFLDANGSGTTANAVNAIEFAIQAKQVLGAGANVRVLSNSWGGGAFSQALLDEIRKADAANVLFVAAAGNSGRDMEEQGPHYPSSYDAPNVVAVAATDPTDTLATWSNYGQWSVDLAAPGVGIYSTVRNRYGTMDGTSMAAPHVSGAAALVLSVPACSTLTPAELRSVLVGYTDTIPALVGSVLTGGRLNVATAVNRCSQQPLPVLPEPGPDFSITATPALQSVQRGFSATYEITLTPVRNFTGTVDLTLTNVPTGATATLPPNVPVTYPEPTKTTLSVQTGSSTKTWTYFIRVTGTSGELVHSTTVRLSVTR